MGAQYHSHAKLLLLCRCLLSRQLANEASWDRGIGQLIYFQQLLHALKLGTARQEKLLAADGADNG